MKRKKTGTITTGKEIRPRVRVSNGTLFFGDSSPLKGSIKRTNPGDTQSKAKRVREAFQGEPVDHAERVRRPDPKVLVLLGRAVAIEYECDKHNGGGDGTKAIYRHEFHKGDILATDQEAKTLYIIGSRLRVNSRGIVD
jgi:hypothetical protein